MIVTRSWLSEFIDLSSVSNEKLYETFNAIGLEVDSLTQVNIAPKVVIGRILSCEKHPDADKLNVCQIDVGEGTRQIVCGAANVVDAEYVAVATVGAVLPGDFVIKDATLRGVESAGMVCAASELGLPAMGKGIMILDESIGQLVVGKELGAYEKVADTIIELELTANRGDCLSIYGVARDLSTALDIPMKPYEYQPKETLRRGIGREADLRYSGEMDADLHYQLATIKQISDTFLISLRLAMVGVEAEGKLASLLAYATHTTGVILRTYDASLFRNDDQRISVHTVASTKGVVEIKSGDRVFATAGVNQSSEGMGTDRTKEILIEASYIHPDLLVEAVAEKSLETDALYYKTSRGSNPDVAFGIAYLNALLDRYTEISLYEGSLNVHVERVPHAVSVGVAEIVSIIGMEVETSRIVTILQKLGFKMNAMGHDRMAAHVPLFRHDIKNVQDVAEEIVRMVGINHIDAKPLSFAEQPRLNTTTNRYQVKKAFKHRAVGAAFYENVSYVFSERAQLQKYGFPTVEEGLDLANPIAEELNTLRSTILVNLLGAVKRNVSYSIKSIPLFEIGAVFDAQRHQKEVISFVLSGQVEAESIKNAGKPRIVDFAHFTQKLGAVIGAFELEPCTYVNGLIHPYQSANIVKEGKVCGFLSKLHPTVQEALGVPQTFIAELDFDTLLPEHINVTAISKFQGVAKDLSVVIDKNLRYHEVSEVLKRLDIALLKEFYPVDVYEDEKLGEKKSLTLRFVIQSMEKTLEESDIESVMQEIMQSLQNACKAELR